MLRLDWPFHRASPLAKLAVASPEPLTANDLAALVLLKSALP